MPRTRKDFEDRRQQIISGALAVFSSKGFEKATNKDIAKAAGIGSPGLIYHYFKDKKDLLQQVMAERAPVGQLVSQRETLMTLPPSEALTIVATTMLNGLANPQVIAVARLVLGEALRRPQIAQLAYKTVSRHLLHLLNDYFEHQMNLGVMRRMNVPATTRCFLGPIAAYIITSEILDFEDIDKVDQETMISTTVDIFLGGMCLEQPE